MIRGTKVFCIGWHKTGTTTLGDALIILGYNVLGARLDMVRSLLEGDISTPIDLASNFDALQDVPWCALFESLDQKFPGSKFILTVRDEDEWLNSAQKHFKDSYFPMHEWLYGDGILLGNEELYLSRFRDHNERVKKYFHERQNDILIMDLASGDSWDKLCTFLNKPIPNKPFPHSNKGRHNYSSRDWVIDSLRNIIPWNIRVARVKILERFGVHRARNRFNNHFENRRERNPLE